jgi:Protein of unknown function (DUF3106)
MRQGPPPVQERPQRPGGGARPEPNYSGRALQNPGHLGQWMQSHKDLSLPEQQRALQNEPGFRELPPQLQQRYLNQLGRLYYMKPQQRERELAQTEILERMSPGQRQQYSAAAQQLYALPPARQRLIAHAMIDLRDMPPAQREQVVSSPAFAAEFPDPGDRAMIHTLLTAEPYSPALAPPAR